MWIKKLFAKRKSLDEVRKWLSSEEGDVDDLRDILRNIVREDALSAVAERDEFLALKSELEIEFSSVSAEKLVLMNSLEYKALKEGMVARVNRSKVCEEAILVLFEPLQDFFARYAKSSSDALIQRYAIDPIDALVHDYSLNIISRLPVLSSAVLSGSIECDSGVIMRALGALKRDELSRLIHSYGAAKREEGRIGDFLVNERIVQELDRINLRLSELSVKINESALSAGSVVIPSDALLIADFKNKLLEKGIMLI